jgi:hypothetical protein
LANDDPGRAVGFHYIVGLAKYERNGVGYSSDLNDAEWAVIEPRLPQRNRLGPRPKAEASSFVNALLYVVQTATDVCGSRRVLGPLSGSDARLRWHG